MILLAQEGGLEVLEGETLYKEGWLLTLSDSFQTRSRLHDEDGRISDPLDRSRIDNRVIAGANYGLRRDLTLGALLPYVYRSFESDAGDLDSDGVGDSCDRASLIPRSPQR